ncbi:MAG: radical SAM protein [Firmicutes bacterium]|nr:radical SAM protein [Bacillota bacterium]
MAKLSEINKVWDNSQAKKKHEKYLENKGSFLFPERITVELTNRCNLSCPMCPRRFLHSSEGFMEEKIFTGIIDEMSEHPGTALVPFFRGESLLHKNFLKFIEYAKKKSISPVQFTTNATLLTEEISSKLLDLKIEFISLSLDTDIEENYRKVRVGASYKKVMENIERFLKMKTERNLDRPEIQVSVVDTSYSGDELESFVKRWIDKVDRVRIYEEHSKGGKFGSIGDDRMGERLPCLKPVTDMVIYWNGDVVLCNHDWDREVPIGNVNKQTISEIWKSSKYESIRKKHLKRNLEGEKPCFECRQWEAYYLPGGIIGKLYKK